ncbi:histidine kinase [Halosegnis marinus]|uniref:histidine kinase n=1 Tax=Halosegnis marinus TaxID=3034023 RepID=UPI003612496D
MDSDEPTPLTRLLEDAFENQPVTVATATTDTVDGPRVVLVEGGETVAVSPLGDLMDAYLLVNSDSYRTATAGLDRHGAPDVLTALAGTRFRVRGYPVSNKEKLLLVVLSRYIEARALAADGGTLRSSFQRLSRIDDERGTRAVYERLGASAVDTHVYGVPDYDDMPDGLSVHGGTDPAYRRTWFVVFTPDDEQEPAALVAVEAGANEWNGYWTFDADLVADIEGVVAGL